MLDGMHDSGIANGIRWGFEKINGQSQYIRCDLAVQRGN